MLLQRRDAPAPRLSRTAARLPKALDPDNRRAGTDIKLLGRRAPRRPAFNFRNHSRPHVFRIGLRHRPASQNRINADRLSHPSPSENLLDSIGTEHALGWTEGRNIRIDYRWAGTDLEAMGRSAVELVALNPDGILSANTPTTAALLQQTRTIPIIFATVGDPTGSGFVESFSRPGGNVTGFTTLEGSLGGKWLELLKEVAPRLSRAAFLFSPGTSPFEHFLN